MITDQIIHLVSQHWAPLVLALTLGWLVRNRYHNGLNKYPGPFLASITDLWRFIDVYGRRAQYTHINLHRKHGSVVRLGPNVLSFSDPEALKVIYGLNKGFVKSNFYIVQQSVANGHALPSLFSTTDNDFHQQFRRSVNSAFAMSQLIQYEPFVDSTMKLFLEQTKRLYIDNPETCDFSRWLQFYAFDVIGEITYSKRHGFVEKNEDIDGIVGYLGNLFLYVAPIGQIPILDKLLLKNPIYLKLSQWGLIDSTFPVARFARARMAERMPEIVLGSAEKPSPLPTAEKLPSAVQKTQLLQTPDLLSKFMAARDARPDFMTEKLVQTMAVSMAFAGSETTAISLSAVFYYLLKNPRALARLQEELDDAGRRGVFSDYELGTVTWHEAQGLPYLDACVKEAFRLHPAPGLHLERIVPEGGVEIAGEFVKVGTIVGCSPWVVHRNESVFGNEVDEYRPERWLVDEKVAAGEKGDKEEVARVKLMNSSLLHFGMGSRTCIGKNISLLEMYKLVPTMLRRFEIQFEDPEREWTTINAWFVKQTDFFTRFKLRELVLPQKETVAAGN